MKKIIYLLLVLFLTACQASVSKPTLTYSNLVDQQSQQELKAYLVEYGVSEQVVDQFLEDVQSFNETIQYVDLVKEGYRTIDTLSPEYDEAAMIEKWDTIFPNENGHNCRITSFRLLGEFIDFKNPSIDDDTMLFIDKDSLDHYDSLKGINKQHFLSLFSYVPTKDTQDVAVHVEKLKENWKSKGITFKNDKIQLISVIFNTNIEELPTTSKLFVGHVGILFENKDGKFVFLEKLSFSTPYQMIIFESKDELNRYIMTMYDVDENQPIAAPFIMENDQLLSSYKRLR